MATRAEMRRERRALEKSEAKRFYTEKEFQRAVDAQVSIIRDALEKRHVEDYMPDVIKNLDEEWKKRLDDHAMQAWALMINSAIWVLHKEFGFGEKRAGRFAEAVAEVYNNEPDLLKMQEEIFAEIGIKIGFQ